jgi:hypothetical protein
VSDQRAEELEEPQESEEHVPAEAVTERAVQLRLLPGRASPTGRPEWALDERTRAVGRRGVAEARAILRRARQAS